MTMAAFLQDNIFADRYTLVEFIGDDGLSQTWKAKDAMSAQALVIIRIYVPEQTSGDTYANSAAVSLASLRHKHLLNTTHADVYEGYPYLVMPYLPKGSLQLLLQQAHRFEEKEVARILRDISAALAYLHEQKPPVLHGEIRPENILIAEDNRYMLTDPRLSIGARNESPYAAPELFVFRPVKSAASDIFSLGVLLYQLCTGALPWEGKGGVSLLEGGEIPHLPASYSRELNAIVRTCLSPHKTQRPSAKQLKQSAEGLLKKEGGKAAPKLQSKSNLTSREKTLPKASGGTSNAPKMGKKTVAMLLSALVLLVIAGILYFTAVELPGENNRSAADAEPAIAAAEENVKPADEKIQQESAPLAAERPSPVEETKEMAPVAEPEETAPGTTMPSAAPVEKLTSPTEAAKPVEAGQRRAPASADNIPPAGLVSGNNTSTSPVSSKEAVTTTAFRKPSSLSEYLNRLSDTNIPRAEREKWRSDISKYFSDKDHLIIDGKAGLISGTYTIDELVSFLMRTRDTKVMINQQRTDAKGKVSELHVEIIPKNPAQ